MKKKDKKHKNPIERNPFFGIRWSQGIDQASPRFTPNHDQKYKSVFKNYSQRNIQKKAVTKLQTNKNQGRFSGNCSPDKCYLIEKNNNKFATSNATPTRKTIKEEIKKKGSKNIKRNFKFIYQIGFGGFGRVWKVQDRIVEKDFAMK